MGDAMIPPELNDAAFIVMQLEPTELADIKALRDLLRHFAVFDATAVPQVRAHAQHAATVLNLILLGGTENAAVHLAQAGAAIDTAISCAVAQERHHPRCTRREVSAMAHDARDHDARDADALDVAMSAPVSQLPAARDGGAIPDDADLALLRDFIAESREAMIERLQSG